MNRNVYIGILTLVQLTAFLYGIVDCFAQNDKQVLSGNTQICRYPGIDKIGNIVLLGLVQTDVQYAAFNMFHQELTKKGSREVTRSKEIAPSKGKWGKILYYVVIA